MVNKIDFRKFKRWVSDHRERFEDELCQWLRIPSVSADPERAGDVQKAADWLGDHLKKMGFKTRQYSEGLHPFLVARHEAGPDRPRVLLYGHFDVQPAEPLDQWRQDPFEPVRRGGFLYARGASDNKGQFFAHIKAIEGWLRIKGELPVNLTILAEGEEEIGSPNLPRLLRRIPRELRADYLVISDGSQLGPKQPAICYGLRGLAYFEITVFGPNRDLHSGAFGGAVVNPANALAGLLAGLHDDTGRIAIPGFYDDVLDLDADERRMLKRLGSQAAELAKELGVACVGGETGYSVRERTWARPTCDINGLSSGHTSAGVKTIIPATATAKVSFRLVPRQSPRKVASGLRKFIKARVPKGVRVDVKALAAGAEAVLTNRDSPGIRTAKNAIRRGFGVEPVFVREGGSIPVVPALIRASRAEPLLIGFGRPDDRCHSPNERFNLTDFRRGILTSAILLENLSRP